LERVEMELSSDASGFSSFHPKVRRLNMSGPFCDCSAADGFHVLKDKWAQKSCLRQQSEHLIQEFQVALDATFEAAPKRRQGFQLDRDPTIEIDTTERERRWERAALRRWNASGLSPVARCWDRLISFQVPLFDKQEKASWGYIDLLGVILKGTPVVVELKKEPATNPVGGTKASESPLRMVLEAAAYAIALRKNWGRFRPEFVQRLKTLELPDSTIAGVPQELSTVRLVGLAPASYWIDWLPVTAKGLKVTPDAWRAFADLLAKFDQAGLPVSFASLSGDIESPESLAAQPLERFPLISA